MGLRGCLPTLATDPPERLTDLAPPEWLGGGLACDFWLKHFQHLDNNNLLNVETQDSFALACSLWQRIHENQGSSRTYLDTVKAYTSLAKLFRLLPVEKGGRKPERFDDKEDFNF